MDPSRLEFNATPLSRMIFYLLAYGWILFSLYMFVCVNTTLVHKPGQIIGFLFIGIILFGVTGLMSNYCIVEGDTLIIKNHIWFWKRKEYDLTKLFSIDYVYLPKIGFSFKIKIKNAASNLHGINGISNEDITALYHIFKNCNIKLTGFTIIDKT